jgi:hypothetical protein
MATIQDYPSLIQAIQDFAHRADLVTYFPTFVQFAELRIYRDLLTNNQGNGVKWMEQPLSAYTDPVLGSIPLPTGYLALKEMQVSDGDGDQFTLLYKDPQWLYDIYPIRQPTGLPAYVARDFLSFAFGPYPDDSYEISGTYYCQSPRLSPYNTTNWMTTYCPELLHAASMLEVVPMLRDTAGLEMWTQIYAQKMTSLIQLDQADRLSPGTMTMETE